MSNSKIFFDNSSVKFLIFLSLINFSIYGCYSVSFYHDTDKLREIHDGEISAVRSLYFDKDFADGRQLKSEESLLTRPPSSSIEINKGIFNLLFREAFCNSLIKQESCSELFIFLLNNIIPLIWPFSILSNKNLGGEIPLKPIIKCWPAFSSVVQSFISKI